MLRTLMTHSMKSDQKSDIRLLSEVTRVQIYRIDIWLPYELQL